MVFWNKLRVELKIFVAMKSAKELANLITRQVWRCYQFLTDVPADRGVILLFHVLEHIPDSQQFLEQLQDNFPQAKTFVIEVPNNDEVLNSLFENKAYRKNQHSSEHLFYFNPQTLRNIVESSKMEIQVETQLQRYTLANHFGWLKNQERGGQDI